MIEFDRRTFMRGVVAVSAGIGAGMRVSCSEPENTIKRIGGKADFPTKQIGKHKISRLIVGGNPFSFIAHSEPLIYSNRLFKHYFTHEKTVETLSRCVRNGINTFLGRIDDNVLGFLNLYEKTTGERIQWIAQTSEKPDRGASKKDIEDNIRLAADNGAIGCYVQGGSADYFVAEENLRDLEDHISLMKRLGMLGGMGAHLNKTVEEAEKAGIEPDFYMKTINRLGFYAADYDRTAEIMSNIDIPWIAFKVLAAGRIKPEEGFKFALDVGADFLCVGMFDFQVDENVKMVKDFIAQMSISLT